MTTPNRPGLPPPYLRDTLAPLLFNAVMISAVVYVLLFVVCFEMFSLPVRSNDGWFGPTPRFEIPGMIEMGDFRALDEKPMIYNVFFPLCWLWLRFNPDFSQTSS